MKPGGGSTKSAGRFLLFLVWLAIQRIVKLVVWGNWGSRLGRLVEPFLEH